MPGGWHPLLVEDSSRDGWRPTFVHNISKGGLCFDMPGPVALADQMQFKTQVDITLDSIRCKGAVVRLNERPDGREIDPGVLHPRLHRAGRQ